MRKIPLLSEPFESHNEETYFKFIKQLEKNVETKKRGTKNGNKRRSKSGAEDGTAEENAGTVQIT